MRDLVRSLPDQLEKALQLPLRNVDPHAFEPVTKIVFLGMGSSSLAGHMVRDLLPHLPVFLSQSYDPPAFLDAHTLVVVTSYSGNTKETLSAYHQALKKNCRVFGMTSGGKLLEQLVEEGKPHVLLPAGMPPRASLPYQLIALLRFFALLGHASMEQGLPAFARSLLPWADAQAAALAPALQGRFPFIYGTCESAALRFKIMLNENAKVPAKAETFPELNHNEVVGWQSPPPGPVAVVFLRDPAEREEIAASIQFLQDTIRDRALLREVQAQGQTPLQKLLSWVLVGDLTSVALAELQGIDPTAVEYINTLKQIIHE